MSPSKGQGQGQGQGHSQGAAASSLSPRLMVEPLTYDAVLKGGERGGSKHVGMRRLSGSHMLKFVPLIRRHPCPAPCRRSTPAAPGHVAHGCRPP